MVGTNQEQMSKHEEVGASFRRLSGLESLVHTHEISIPLNRKFAEFIQNVKLQSAHKTSQHAWSPKINTFSASMAYSKIRPISLQMHGLIDGSRGLICEWPILWPMSITET